MASGALPGVMTVGYICAECATELKVQVAIRSQMMAPSTDGRSVDVQLTAEDPDATEVIAHYQAEHPELLD